MIESEPYAEYDAKNCLQPTNEMLFSKLFAGSCANKIALVDSDPEITHSEQTVDR